MRKITLYRNYFSRLLIPILSFKFIGIDCSSLKPFVHSVIDITCYPSFHKCELFRISFAWYYLSMKNFLLKYLKLGDFENDINYIPRKNLSIESEIIQVESLKCIYILIEDFGDQKNHFLLFFSIPVCWKNTCYWKAMKNFYFHLPTSRMISSNEWFSQYSFSSALWIPFDHNISTSPEIQKVVLIKTNSIRFYE